MRIKNFLNTIKVFLISYIVSSFVTTCSLLIYLSSLMETLGHEFTEVEIREASIITFNNILIIALLFTFLYYIVKKITVDIPIKKIKNCLSSLMNGDFSARVKIKNNALSTSTFDEIAEDINKLAQELGGVEMLRNDFISNVSHEIKTPLTVIQNYSMLLSSPFLEEDKRVEYASIIGENSRKLARLVTNILRLNKLENQKVYPNKEEYDLSEEICSSLVSFEDTWTKKDISLTTDIQQGIVTNGDKDLLSLVWSNLFSNAFKFTSEKGEVNIKLKLYGEKAMLIVSDTGCGMDEYTLRHIWDKFYQGDTSHTQEGNGLGLALVKRALSIYKGEIEVKSEVGKGSTFIVTLPFCREG